MRFHSFAKRDTNHASTSHYPTPLSPGRSPLDWEEVDLAEMKRVGAGNEASGSRRLTQYGV
jgi:hypothetical protein